MLMCKDTYERPQFLFQMCFTYLMYTLFTIIKVQPVAEKKRIAFKDCFNFFNCSFKFTFRRKNLFFKSFLKTDITKLKDVWDFQGNCFVEDKQN